MWPPPGAFPYRAYVSRQPDHDVGGWTIETFDAPLDTAKVVLTEDGVEQPIVVNVLEKAAGSNYGLRFVPSGWNAKAGSTYEVTVTRIASPFRYEVELVACP